MSDELMEPTMNLRVRVRVDVTRALHAAGDPMRDGEPEFGRPELEGHVQAEIKYFLESRPYVLEVQVDDMRDIDNERVWRSMGAPPSSVRLPEDDEKTGI